MHRGIGMRPNQRTKAVVDVLDVAPADPKIALNGLRVQSEGVHYKVAGACTAVAQWGEWQGRSQARRW